MSKQAAATPAPATPTTARKAPARKVAKPAAKAAAKPAKKAPQAAPAKPVKAAKAVKVEKAVKPVKADKKPAKPPRVKLVRDGFTMPETDFALFAALKARALKAQRETKKSELLRAGLQALAAMSDAQLLAALQGLAPVKIGRPKGG